MARPGTLATAAASALLGILVIACGGETDDVSPPGGGGSGGHGGVSVGGAPMGGVGGSSGAADRARCEQILGDYATPSQEVTTCNPILSSFQCQTLRPLGLVCACMTVVNERQTDALAELDRLSERWVGLGCRSYYDVACGPCPPASVSTTTGGCSPDGQCLSGP